ncbi:DUF3644 domain-containing protein [Pelagibacterium sp.]|uniref:DUF3644 domain-containing protein n=1 Tax=Pelagibacterium sp. TaxID=1967288 RepID=UPI003A8DB1A3
MRKEAKTLHSKALDSLILGVDHFNRAWDRGRHEAVLIMLDRAFELLLKAIIIHKGGRIREARKQEMTIGFDVCLRRCVSDAKLKCLTEDDAVSLQSLNALRDAAQHYMIELSEEHLYVYAQSAVTLFARLCADELGLPMRNEIPERVLPVCARPPKDLGQLFDAEFEHIKAMVAPGSRKRLDAKAKLRSLAVLQASLDGRKSQASDRELDQIVARINDGADWRDIFPGVSTLTIDPEADGPGLLLRITRNQGEAIHLVNEGDPNASVIAVRKVNELDFYNIGLHDLAQKLQCTPPKLLCLIRHDGMQDNPDYFKLIKVGRQEHKRYSPKALAYLKIRLQEIDLEDIWEASKEAA